MGVRIRDRLAQRARAAVVAVRDGERIGRDRDERQRQNGYQGEEAREHAVKYPVFFIYKQVTSLGALVAFPLRHVAPAAEQLRRIDHRDVGEGLWEIAELAFRPRIVLLGVKAEVVA